MGEYKQMVLPQMYSEVEKQQNRMLLANNLRIARKNAGLSQSDVMKALVGSGKNRNRISEIETGKVEVNIHTFLFLCQLYGQSADYILGLSCEPINDVLAATVNNIKLNTYKYLEPLIEVLTEKTVSHLKAIGTDNYVEVLSHADDITQHLMTLGGKIQSNHPELYAAMIKLANSTRKIRLAEAQRDMQLYAQLDAINERHDQEDGHLLVSDIRKTVQYTLPLAKPQYEVVEVACE